MSLILFHTAGCHLCDLAEEVVQQALKQMNRQSLTVEKIDIADSESLLDAYGVKIPVLKQTTNPTELNWPFSPEDVEAWLL